MTEVRDGGVTLLAQYTYDPLSRLTTTTYDNGAQTTHAYELDDDLSQVAQSYGMGSVTFDTLYNLVNQRTDTSVDDNAYLWRPDQDVTNDYLPNALNQYNAPGYGFNRSAKHAITLSQASAAAASR